MIDFTLKTELYNHQKEAVAKQMSSRVGALFMDMGTGKTRTAIELVYQRRKRISKVVWFCPVSLKRTICEELEKHSKGLKIKVDGDNQRGKFDWYVIGIESMAQSPKSILFAIKIIDRDSYVIIDESSFIKNAFAKRTQNITRLSQDCRYRLILNGTPISNGIQDMYSQSKFLSPKILGYNSFYSFANNHLVYDEKNPRIIRRTLDEDYIAECMKPYVYQVKKSECVDLPEKVYKKRYFSMTSNQCEQYELAKCELLQQYSDDMGSYYILHLFTVLQQISCGFVMNENVAVGLNHKRLDVLEEIIDEIPEDEKVIIWCKYKKDIENISGTLKGVSIYDGSLSSADRDEQLEKFKGDNRFLLGTQSCAGFGLNLAFCHNVVFYDNDFKYSNRIQAEDRCHRIGQKNSVVYYDIVCDNGIEERIMNALSNKKSILKAFESEIENVKDFKKLKKLLEAL